MLGQITVAVRDHRARECHAPNAFGVGVEDGDGDAFERDAVVDAAAAGLTHAVSPDDGQAGVECPAQERGGGCGATDEEGVGAAESCGGTRGVEDFDELCGNQRGVAARTVEGVEGVGEGVGIEAGRDVEDAWREPGSQCAEENLESGDVVRGEREEPIARSAKVFVRRGR